MDHDSQPTFSPSATLIGMLLLIPLLILAFSVYLLPTLGVFQTAQTDGNLLSTPEFIGMENYQRLTEDRAFVSGFGYSLSIGLTRLAAVLLMPPLIGILVGLQPRGGRIIQRLLLSVMAGLLSPLALTLLWGLFWGRLWGSEPSPITPVESLMLSSPEGARNSILLLDFIITLAIGVVTAGVAFMAVVRGRQTGQSAVLSAGLAVWLIAAVIAFGSGFLSFTLPFILTQGGPANATTTMMFSIYRDAFQMFRFGYASAKASLLVVGSMMAALLIGFIAIGLRLRLSYVPAKSKQEDQRAVWGVFTFLLMVLAFAPVVLLVLWGVASAGRADGWGSLMEQMPLAQSLLPTLLPVAVIWLVQVPITYLAGLALGFVRPFGTIGSNLIFLFVFVVTSIPTEALSMEWFVQARALGILNTPSALALPWLVSGLALFVFKLFFDGTHDAYQAVRDTGASAATAFMQTVLRPSLPSAVLVGVVLSYISIQSLLWPLLMISTPENMPLTLQLVLLQGQFGPDNSAVLAGTVVFIGIFILPFAVLLCVLHLFALDRLALVSGLAAAESDDDLL